MIKLDFSYDLQLFIDILYLIKISNFELSFNSKRKQNQENQMTFTICLTEKISNLMIKYSLKQLKNCAKVNHVNCNTFDIDQLRIQTIKYHRRS